MPSQDEIDKLLKRRGELQLELAEVLRKLDVFRMKCPGCRCRILPGTSCPCCASSETFGDSDE